MILLDTNVISEALRPAPSDRVLRWLDEQDPRTLFLSAVSLAELLAGAAYLPPGRRRSDLERSLAAALRHLFADRILPFDAEAATVFAPLMARARAQGAPIGFADGQIAAVAAARGFAVASRDTAPFAAAGLRLIDPWSA